VGTALTDLVGVTLQGAVEAATRSICGDKPCPTRFTVIALGRLGGSELGYSSDADVMFVHDPLPGVAEQEATGDPRPRSPTTCVG